MDFETMLRNAMKQGTSLEDVMKSISAAATKIEKDKETASKYDVFNKPVNTSFQNANTAAMTLLHSDKISVHDAAIVIAHFVCQNVPGYAQVLAKDGADPVKTYEKMLETQIRIAKVATEHQNDSDRNKNKALLDCLLDEALGTMFGKDEAMGTFSKWLFGDMHLPTTNSTNKPTEDLTKPTTDADKITKFFKDMGLV